MIAGGVPVAGAKLAHLDDPEFRALELLRAFHVGPGRAITGERLAEALGFSGAGRKRRAQLVVERLRKRHQLPVLYVNERGPDRAGYYWPADWGQVIDVVGAFRRRRESLEATEQALAACVPENCLQMEMFVGPEGGEIGP